MDKEKKDKIRLIDILRPNTPKGSFELLVRNIITAEDMALFGDKARDLVAQSLLYPAVFASYPSTFDTEAYAFVIDDAAVAAGYDGLIDTDRINRLLWISLENGILEMHEDGRLGVPKGVTEIILPILKQYND